MSRMDRMVRKNGFTMVEAVIVLALLSFLATTLYPACMSLCELRRRTMCLLNLGTLSKAGSVYAGDFTTYPNFARNLSMMKIHKSSAKGLGLLVCNDYVPASPEGIGLLFCPSAKPHSSIYDPQRALKALTCHFDRMDYVRSTYSAHFCSLSGRELSPYRRPDPYDTCEMLIADLVFDEDDPQADSQQSHTGTEYCVSYIDASASIASFGNIQQMNHTSAKFNNSTHDGNFWYCDVKRLRR